MMALEQGVCVTVGLLVYYVLLFSTPHTIYLNNCTFISQLI